MNKIGILYICTGKYNVFWEKFYQSFEKYFMKDCELHYFVFTDADTVFDEENNHRIHRHYLETLPWPLITLFRFHTFLSIKDELEEMDYLLFSNSNMECVTEVKFDEMMPRTEKGEALFTVMHPGYFGMKSKYAPLERSAKSYAYVPYRYQVPYVIGAMNGGTSKAFLKMAETLKWATEEDLKRNVIARWHDESQLNRYIADRDDVRILTPEYCYPFGMDVTYQPRIAAVSKKAKFDVDSFKGVDNTAKPSKLDGCVRMMNVVLTNLRCLRDTVLNRKVREYGI
ncbi:MAG: family 6 glucosyltransferase [Lachnospiraceae bacterium]|nr:family 6 glucosyltransferase [Lachnospiraceae bacterium]